MDGIAPELYVSSAASRLAVSAALAAPKFTMSHSHSEMANSR